MGNFKMQNKLYSYKLENSISYYINTKYAKFRNLNFRQNLNYKRV